MMNTDKKIIESAVWDCTIGAGNDSETIEDDDLTYISERLERALTPDDKKLIERHWRQCLQMMAQP